MDPVLVDFGSAEASWVLVSVEMSENVHCDLDPRVPVDSHGKGCID